MKTKILLALCLLTVSSALFCQAPPPKGSGENFEQFKAEKVAFLTKIAELTPEEAGLVFPVYDKAQEERFKLNRTLRDKIKNNFGKEKSPSVEDYEKANEEMYSLSEQEAIIEKECYQKLKAILSPEKLFKFKVGEDRFLRHIVRRMGNKGKEKAEK